MARTAARTLESLGLLLELEGARLERINGGHEALRRLNERDPSAWPQALVYDIALGHEDGHAVVRGIRMLEARREVPLGRRLPAIALTGMWRSRRTACAPRWPAASAAWPSRSCRRS